MTLSNKIIVCNDKNWTNVIPTEDVKEFIKDMDDWIGSIGRTTLITGETFMNILKEKAGDKLIDEKFANLIKQVENGSISGL